MNKKILGSSAAIMLGSVSLSSGAISAERPGLAPVPQIDDEGTITVPSFELPFSSFASPQAREAEVKRQRDPWPLVSDVAESRRVSDQKMKPRLDLIRRMYRTTSARSTIGTVPIDTYVPSDGIADENRNRVLLEIHGGAFTVGGGGIAGALESIPIAAMGKIKVVSVDYRLAPEHRFPAASEDIETVYRELLKTYRPENIGLYGCSAGGWLSATSIPWFLKEKLPLPGAIGVFCASIYNIWDGDSAQLWSRLGSVVRELPPKKPNGAFGPLAYFEGVSTDNPLAAPGASIEVLKAFPPTLFLTGTRSPEMSGVVQGHLELRDLGRESEVLLFDGMDHGFYSDASLPEAQRAYRLITRFFGQHLGKLPK